MGVDIGRPPLGCSRDTHEVQAGKQSGRGGWTRTRGRLALRVRPVVVHLGAWREEPSASGHTWSYVRAAAQPTPHAHTRSRTHTHTIPPTSIPDPAPAPTIRGHPCHAGDRGCGQRRRCSRVRGGRVSLGQRRRAHVRTPRVQEGSRGVALLTVVVLVEVHVCQVVHGKVQLLRGGGKGGGRVGEGAHGTCTVGT